MRKLRWLCLLILVCALSSCSTNTTEEPKAIKLTDGDIQEVTPVKTAVPHPSGVKREFRGAWIQTVFQNEYAKMTGAEMQKDFIHKLDFLKKCGINAIIFQVRPEGDAWYPSKLEPWSRFLTGKQGIAPNPVWDPMAFMIAECHKRNMEFHAWINPYRASASDGSSIFAENHLYRREPERFLSFGNLIVFDPGLPENRTFICSVVRDIVTRYDVDAIHADDYFYPYPIAGTPFPDEKSFATYGLQQGWKANQLNDWRRNNVDLLIYQIKQVLLDTKPWVRLGISPFGIYRNKTSTPDGSGSETSGLQNYDDLYADVLKWAQSGWIDYNMPQIYWEIGHKRADYITLAHWWNEHTGGRHLYVGQNVVRTMELKELKEKIELTRSLPNIGGNCFWPANELLNNRGGIADELRTNYHRYPALIPAYTRMNPELPQEVTNLKVKNVEGGYLLEWDSDSNKTNPNTAAYYVIYRIPNGTELDLNNPQYIVLTTRNKSVKINLRDEKRHYNFGVTAVNRYHNESPKGVWKKLKI